MLTDFNFHGGLLFVAGSIIFTVVPSMVLVENQFAGKPIGYDIANIIAGSLFVIGSVFMVIETCRQSYASKN